MKKIHVTSEIGKLKTVLLHEPGEELHNLTPKHLDDLLFDDIPWLPLAKKEHQRFDFSGGVQNKPRHSDISNGLQ